MAGARLVVMASTWYEGLPLVLVEALASGTPCLVPNLGGMPEVIRDGETGTVMPAPNPEDPTASDTAARGGPGKRAWDTAPQQRAACRTAYEARYTPDVHYRAPTCIYEAARNENPPPQDLFGLFHTK